MYICVYVYIYIHIYIYIYIYISISIYSYAMDLPFGCPTPNISWDGGPLFCIFVFIIHGI